MHTCKKEVNRKFSCRTKCRHFAWASWLAAGPTHISSRCFFSHHTFPLLIPNCLMIKIDRLQMNDFQCWFQISISFFLCEKSWASLKNVNHFYQPTPATPPPIVFYCNFIFIFQIIVSNIDRVVTNFTSRYKHQVIFI